MPEVPLRFRWLRRVGEVVATIGVVCGLAMVAIGIVFLWRPSEAQDPIWLTTGITLMLGGVFTGALSFLVFGLFVLALKIEGTLNRLHSGLLDIDERVVGIAPLLKDVAQNTQISDAAKSIAHRAKEREALRSAIREEILHQDWEAAYYLIDQMEHRFGYRQEATRIRREVDTSRQEAIEHMIVEALNHIEELCDQRNWELARTEADRLLRLFPSHERVKDVMDVVERKRDGYKAELLRSYHEAFGRNEAERCVDILKEMDGYLTRSEAEALAETARSVFRDRLMNLHVRFSLAVTERRWRDALECGLQITNEFPNTRMALEVREKLPALQKRAGFSSEVAADVIELRTPGSAK